MIFLHFSMVFSITIFCIIWYLWYLSNLTKKIPFNLHIYTTFIVHKDVYHLKLWMLWIALYYWFMDIQHIRYLSAFSILITLIIIDDWWVIHERHIV